ncbi:MAG TPA: FAD-dependent oxidoreductase [Pseudonocardiaceae bacterium]|jgi:flavin-dependent dehydrogenase
MATQGIVLGGGVAGQLAAAVLARRMDAVTMVERDRYEEANRKGVPQARHAHLLLARGAMAVDEIVPGTIRALVAAGAKKVMMPGDIITFTPHGWLPRFDNELFLISCQRALFESVLRARIGDGFEVLQGCDAVGLVGDSGRVSGVRVRDRDTGSVRQLDADLVVDATGAGSKAPRWLAELGVVQQDEVVVDAGIRYATRIFQPPAELVDAFPAVCVQPDPGAAPHGGVVLPIEGGRWIVSLTGLRGHEPPTDEAGFARFADGLRHRLVADLIATARPEGPIRGYAAPPNRLRRFGEVPGFVAIGDAVCTVNPLYGHGMTVAALSALALREHGRQQDIDKVNADAWALAIGQDVRHGETIAPAQSPLDRVRTAYADRLGMAATVDQKLAATLLDAYTLMSPLSSLLRPRTVVDVLFSRRTHRADNRPPISRQEAALVPAAQGER